jgi:hypothetical protein
VRLIKIGISVLLLSAIASHAAAQTLPAGTGSIIIGGRQYVGDPVFFNQSGESSALASRFSSNFDSACISSGKCGTDLKKLYENIKKYDSSSGSSERSLADQLTLGSQRGTVNSKIAAKAIGLGFGITDRITIYGIIPLLDASVDADIDIEGTNNAAAIKNKLGDAAFDELKRGLDQASQFSKSSLLAKITDDYGYRSINHWEYKGIGDIAVGARTAWSVHGTNAAKFSLGLSSQINFPTGPQYDPDSLTQMTLSRGYKSLDLLSDHRVTMGKWALGGELGGGYGLRYDTVRRVPIGDEVLIDADRKNNVSVQPGMDTKGSIYGILGNSSVRGQYKLGVANHHADTFSGPIEGNYVGMGEQTATHEVYHEATLTYSSVRAYKHKISTIPFMVSLSGRDPISGQNVTSGRSFELAFIGFFSTPMHKSDRVRGS